jgi:hypothetical protein
MLTGDKDFVREFTLGVLERLPDRPFLQYQAHRALLFAGDIDGASTLIPAIRASDLPEDTRDIILIRQACAEGRLAEAHRLFETFKEKVYGDLSLSWISHKIIGLDEEAKQMLMPLDESGQIEQLSDFLSYHYFDPASYPNLIAFLRAQGVEPREPLEMPYRCRT